MEDLAGASLSMSAHGPKGARAKFWMNCERAYFSKAGAPSSEARMHAALARESQGSATGPSGSKGMGVGWLPSQLMKREKTAGSAATLMGPEGLELESHSDAMCSEYWQITILETSKMLDEEPVPTRMERVSEGASGDRLDST